MRRTPLRWRPRAPICLDLTLPANAVRIDTAPHPCTAQGSHVLTRIRLHQVDRTGQRWVFYLTSTKGDTGLLIFASFAGGDIEADIGITRG